MKKCFTVILTLCVTVLILITCKKKPEVETYTLTISNENVVVTTTTATITANFSFPTEIYDIKVLISTNSGMSNVTIIPTIISGNKLSVTINDLAMNTKYYYCYRYSNNVNMVDTDVNSFTTLNASLPIITTGEVSDITKTTATGSGNVTDNGGDNLIERGICWSTSHNPSIDGNHANNGTETGAFTVNITGLTANTTYYVKAYAKNSIGTAYGEEISFTTAENSTAPNVMTAEVININKTQARGGGDVISDGGETVTERGICWSTTHNPTIEDNHASNGGGIGSYSILMTGLSVGTTYYVRAYAINSVGTSYGNEVGFTTLANKPTVITNSVTNITDTQAICGGVVTDDGGAPVTERGVCWSTSTNPTTSDQHTTNGNGIGNFVSTLSGLASNTTYYVRAYATNSAGTSYGEQKTFITAKAGWLFYGGDTWEGAMGWIPGGTFTWAVMFPSNLLTTYSGTNITKVKFYSQFSGAYTLKIYRGGISSPTTLIYEQTINTPSTNGWYEVAIQPLELVTTQSLWVSLSINHPAGVYPAVYTTGVNDPNARWEYNGTAWVDATGNEYDFSWTIKAYITNMTKGGEEIELH